MIAAMQSPCREIRVPRSRRWPAMAWRVDGLRHRAPCAVLLTLMLLVSACSIGTSAVSSLATGADRLAGDKSPAALLRIADATRAGGDPASAIGLYRRAHELAPQDPAPHPHTGHTVA